MKTKKPNQKIMWIITAIALVLAVVFVIAAVFCLVGNNEKTDEITASKNGEFSFGGFMDYVTKSSGPVSKNASEYTPLQEKKEQTIMFYIVGSDLESQMGSATSDLIEFMQADVDTQNTNVVIFTGGASYWHNNIVNSDSNYILYLDGNNGYRVIGSTSDILNMGDSSTLATFLEYSYYTFPAENYNLILWNHGGGSIFGYGNDELAGDRLYLPELKASLASSPFSSSNKLGWVMFDACLMSNIETAYVFSDYAEYLIASEESIPAYGLYYSAFNGLTSTNVSAAEVARKVCMGSIDFNNSLNYDSVTWATTYVPFSCLDLSKMDSVESAMKDFFKDLNRNIKSNFNQMSYVRDKMYTYGSYSDGNKQLDLIDMVSFVESVKFLSPEKGQALLDALKEMIVWNYSGTAHDASKGVSFYFPYSASHYYESKALPVYDSLGFCEEYTDFLEDFLTVMDGGTPELWEEVSEETTTTQAATQPPVTVAPQIPSTSSQNITEASTQSPTVPQQNPVTTTAPQVPQTTLPPQNNPSGIPSSQNGYTANIYFTDVQLSSIAKSKKCVFNVCDDGHGFYLVSETADTSVNGNTLSAEFDTGRYFLSDGVNTTEVSLIEVSRTKDEVVYEAPVRIATSGARCVNSMIYEGVGTDLVIVFNKENPDGKVLGFYVSDAKTGKNVLYELEEGMSVLPYAYAIEKFEYDEHGNVVCYRDNSTLANAYPETVLEVRDEITVVKKDYLDTDRIYGTIDITDVYGYSFSATLKKIFSKE